MPGDETSRGAKVIAAAAAAAAVAGVALYCARETQTEAPAAAEQTNEQAAELEEEADNSTLGG